MVGRSDRIRSCFAVALVGTSMMTHGYVMSPSHIVSPSVKVNMNTRTSTLSRMVASQEVSTSVMEEQAQAPMMPRKRTKEERLEAASKGLQVHVVGLSIHHAEVETREKLAVPESEWNEASAAIVASGEVAEAAVLSTCNRFEVYYAASDARRANAAICAYLSKRSGMPVSVLRRSLFLLQGDDAVWHLLKVSGGLDSLIVGEGQILSQVRQCHLHSIEPPSHDNVGGSGGKVLSRLLQEAVKAGKRVRSETAISKGSVSISSAAVELSEMLCSQDLQLPFTEARLTVLGAGKMTRLLLTHLASRGCKHITVLNRSLPRPNELKEQFAQTHPEMEIEVGLMNELWDVIGRSDIVFTATSHPEPLITEEKLKHNGLASGRPMMLVDISVPRNIADDANNVPGVVAYNVDDLKAVVAKNTAMRQREMLEAEDLLREEAAAFVGWRESLSAIPTINQLQEKADAFRQEELMKCTRKLASASDRDRSELTDKELEAVERLSRGIVNKLLHGPLAHLRKTESVEGKQNTLKELSAMFRLEEEQDKRRNKRRR